MVTVALPVFRAGLKKQVRISSSDSSIEYGSIMAKISSRTYRVDRRILDADGAQAGGHGRIDDADLAVNFLQVLQLQIDAQPLLVPEVLFQQVCRYPP